MNTQNSRKLAISACRFCKHYTPEGRRGGTCNILQSSVGGDWQSCCMSAPIFGETKFDTTLEHEFMIRANSIVCVSD